MLSVPYDIENVPHRTWMKALWMMKGDTAGAKRLAKLLDESILPIVEDGEKVFGGKVAARILLEGGIAELLSRVETRQLGRLPRPRRRKRAAMPPAILTATTTYAEPARRGNSGTWLGLCGPDQVRWTVNGVRIPNEVIAEQVLRDAAEDGVSPPLGEPSYEFAVVATGKSEPEEVDLAAYVRSHLRFCGRLPAGANYLGTVRSEEDVKTAREIPGSFVIRDENDDWLLFRVQSKHG